MFTRVIDSQPEIVMPARRRAARRRTRSVDGLPGESCGCGAPNVPELVKSATSFPLSFASAPAAVRRSTCLVPRSWGFPPGLFCDETTVGPELERRPIDGLVPSQRTASQARPGILPAEKQDDSPAEPQLFAPGRLALSFWQGSAERSPTGGTGCGSERSEFVAKHGWPPHPGP